jgi:CheY-like chemotaxis protein
MRPQEKIRVLILEDNTDWRQALAGMYAAIFGHRGEVATVADGAIAERLLHKRPVDILSLDLNLSEGRSEGADGPLKCDSGRLQLIELAARNRWAKSIVLITRSDVEGESRFVACDESKLDEATVSPDEFVRHRFSDRGLVLNKPARWDLPTSLSHFEKLIRRRLPDLARTGYTLRFGGTVHDPRVTIEADRRSIAALVGNDAMLLSALATLARAGEFLSDKSVVEIYRGRAGIDAVDAATATRIAQREIDSLRRRLRRHGVNDRALLRRVRKSDSTGAANPVGAWRIDGSVVTEGMSSIHARGRGGADFRPDTLDPAE